jgi:hypothetical protein
MPGLIIPFEMPINRLLSEDEMLSAVINGYQMDWVKCSICGSEGWTVDNRKHCSLTCYVKAKKLDKNKMEVIRISVLKEEAAFLNDFVKCGDEILKVIATDCTFSRLSRPYNLKFNYVLQYKDTLIKVNDLETPLRRYSIEVI